MAESNMGLTSGSAGDFMKRVIMVFGFWFVIGGVIALSYSEVVTRIYTMRDVDVEESPEDLEERRLMPYQVLGFAMTFGMGMVVTRLSLELLCGSSKETCATVSGHCHNGTGSPTVPEVVDEPADEYDGPPPPQPPQPMVPQPMPQPPPAFVRPAPPQNMQPDPYQRQ
jgi:hypothetical protein